MHGLRSGDENNVLICSMKSSLFTIPRNRAIALWDDFIRCSVKVYKLVNICICAHVHVLGEWSNPNGDNSVISTSNIVLRIRKFWIFLSLNISFNIYLTDISCLSCSTHNPYLNKVSDQNTVGSQQRRYGSKFCRV